MQIGQMLPSRFWQRMEKELKSHEKRKLSHYLISLVCLYESCLDSLILTFNFNVCKGFKPKR